VILLGLVPRLELHQDELPNYRLTRSSRGHLYRHDGVPRSLPVSLGSQTISVLTINGAEQSRDVFQQRVDISR
jgi:hypothetical protein